MDERVGRVRDVESAGLGGQGNFCACEGAGTPWEGEVLLVLAGGQIDLASILRSLGVSPEYGNRLRGTIAIGANSSEANWAAR